MNWLWIFLTALIVAAIITVTFIIGTACGYGTALKRLNDDLDVLIGDYKKALKNNTDFFKQMADAINKITRNGDDS